MSHTLNVLCPSGHTVTVKVGPNDALLTVLEKVAEKRDLSAAKHVLEHNRKKLDLSLTVRYDLSISPYCV